MVRDNRGFSLVEFAIVILVGGILLSIALRGFGATTSRMAVQRAGQVFQGLHAQTRALAVERGRIARLQVEPAGDSAWIEVSDTVRAIQNFRESMGVDLQSEEPITLCMNPRGLGEPGCNSFSGSVTIRLVQGAQESSVELLSMGQIR